MTTTVLDYSKNLMLFPLRLQFLWIAYTVAPLPRLHTSSDLAVGQGAKQWRFRFSRGELAVTQLPTLIKAPVWLFTPPMVSTTD